MCRRLIVALLLVVAWPAVARSQETVQAARQLYASAAYDEALAVLEKLRLSDPPPPEAREIELQRALCLLALGRDAAAGEAIAAVVEADPYFRPDATSASPRVRGAFRQVRERLLPGLVQREYVQARRLYDDKAWAEAASAFDAVVRLASDPDLGDEAGQSLADVRLLADGFARLAHAAATPPPAPPEPEPAAREPLPPAIDYDAIFNGTEPGVVPPVVQRQDVPAWKHPSLQVPRGAVVLEVTISETGVVERATVVRGVAPFFDRALLDGTKHWRYQPAMLDGRPVRFRKSIRIEFK